MDNDFLDPAEEDPNVKVKLSDFNASQTSKGDQISKASNQEEKQHNKS